MRVDRKKAAAGLFHACRLTGVQQPPTRDIFDSARIVASILIGIAGALAIVGSVMDWVNFTLPEAGTGAPHHQGPSAPIGGLDVRDGNIVIIAGVVLLVAALLLVVSAKGRWALLGLISSVVIGAIAIADYRGLGDVSSVLSRKLNVVGEAHAAAGLTLVAGAALLGLIASVLGIAATPYRRAGQQV
ncbi:MAG: hypothetical protein QOC87_1216 [Actinomycetota bacterium]|nr:hypothetical protein [Actinomycetota bacterium]